MKDRIEKLDAAIEAERCADLMLGTEPWITLRLTRARALAGLTDPGKEIYGARGRDGVDGFVVIDMRSLTCGYIQILCVREDRRDQGLGSALLGFAEERIFRDSPNAFICVSSFNPRARGLYERRGFELVGTLSDLLIRGHHELLLRKTRGSWQEFRRDG
jgi:ribosomal protein S18 acetylase RimI-like enzyme